MVDLVTADLHLSENPRDAYRFVFIEETLPRMISEHHVGRVIILGDITEAKDRHSAKLTNRIAQALDEIAAVAKVIILRGNHDYLDADHPFFQFMGLVNGIRWINQVVYDGEDLFIPHTPADKFKFDNKVELKHGYIFCHNTFDGALSESGKVLPGVPVSVFPKRAKVISGDVHVPQVLGPVTYVGAPYRIDFGDDFEPRVLLLNESGRVSLPVEGPQKRLVVFDKPDDLIKRHEVAPGDVVKVVVHLEQMDRDAWWEIKKKVRAWAEHEKIELHTVKPVVEQPAVKAKPLPDRGRKSDETLIREYGKQRNVDSRTLDIGLQVIAGVK